MNAATVRQDEQHPLGEMHAPDAPAGHVATVDKQVTGELMIPGAGQDARTEAVAMVRRVLGRDDLHFGTVPELRQAFNLVDRNLRAVAGSYSQQRLAALVELFQNNGQAEVKQALSKDGIERKSSEYARLSELMTIFNAYMLVGTEALEGAAYDSKGIAQTWEGTKKAITAIMQSARKTVLQNRVVYESQAKVRAAMRIPAVEPLSPEAIEKATRMAKETIEANEREQQLREEAKKTPQGIANRIARQILAECLVVNPVDGSETIDDNKATAILGHISQSYREAVTERANKIAAAEKKEQEARKQ